MCVCLFSNERGELQIHLFDGYQPVSQHIDSGLALFQDDVADQRFVDSVGRLHPYEKYLTEDWLEPF